MENFNHVLSAQEETTLDIVADNSPYFQRTRCPEEITRAFFGSLSTLVSSLFFVFFPPSVVFSPDDFRGIKASPRRFPGRASATKLSKRGRHEATPLVKRRSLAAQLNFPAPLGPDKRRNPPLVRLPLPASLRFLPIFAVQFFAAMLQFECRTSLNATFSSV